MLSRKSSLTVFWTLLALIVVAIVAGMIFESAIPMCAMLVLFGVLLLFCIIQTVQMVEKKTLGTLLCQMFKLYLLFLVISFLALWLTKNADDTFVGVLRYCAGLSVVFVIVDTWYNQLNQHKKKG